MLIKILCAFLLGISGGTPLKTPKISHATVLLSNDPRGVFTLSGVNGCFRFSTDRPDIVNLAKPNVSNNNCATSVVVSVNPELRDQGKAVVMATEIVSQTELRSEILVSSISRLEIVTRVRRLSLGELEAIQVQGYDRFGNTFSSLEGLEFRWDISDEAILKSLPLKSTEYALSIDRLRIEESGNQSDMLLVSGQSAGKASLSVTYASISSQSVLMSIVEPFDVTPHLLSLPVCASGRLAVTSSGSRDSFSFAVPSAVRQQVIVDSAGVVRSLTAAPLQSSVTVTDTRTDDNENTVRVCVGEPTGITFETSTLFPIVGSELPVEVRATSKDCSESLTLEGDEISLKTTGESRKISKSVLAVQVPDREGSEIRISARLGSIQRDSSCSWNTTGMSGSIVLTAAKPLSLVGIEAGTKLLVPIGEKRVSVEIIGGSGQYSIISGSGSVDSAIVHIDVSSLSERIVVCDKYNEKNRVEFQLESVHSPFHGGLGLRSNVSAIETFIGYDRPFEEFIVHNRFQFLNCSSLVDSVTVKNSSIVAVEFAGSLDPFSCGKITIIPNMPGETELVVASHGNGPELIVPLRVHSAFVITTPSIVFGPSKTLIGLNSSFSFSVSGGSLSHLRLGPGEVSPIELSRPWVADVISDAANNRFRVVCRTEGSVSAHVAHTSIGGIDFECVDPTGIVILSESLKDDVYVTCGHGESHSLRIVALDIQNRRIDNSTTEHSQFTSSVDNFTLPPMECNTEITVEAQADFFLGRTVLHTSTTVKARDTVRATMGPQLSRQTLLLPCESEFLTYNVQFTGGSGQYGLRQHQDGQLVGAMTESNKIDATEATLGDLGMYGVSVPADQCESQHTFRVIDEALGEGSGERGVAEVDIRTLRIDQVKLRVNAIEKKKETVAVVVENEWFELTLRIKFNGGQVDSLADPKYFALTENIFGWEVSASVGTVEFKTAPRGKLFARITGISDHTTLTVSSRFVRMPAGNVSIAVLRRPSLVPASMVGAWSMRPGGPEQGLLASHVDLDHLHSLGVVFRFQSESNVTLVDGSGVVAGISIPAGMSGSGSISAILETINGRNIFSINQVVNILQPSDVKINAGNPITVVRGSTVSLVASFVDLFPPHQLADCQVKWSLYGSTLGQSIRYKFELLGAVPVQVMAFCPGLPTLDTGITVHVIQDPVRIKPVANLVTMAVYRGLSWPGRADALQPTPTQESAETVSLSESEVGTVTYRQISSWLFTRTKMDRFVVSLISLLGHVELLDNRGQTLVFPDDMNIAVGTDQPGIFTVLADRDQVSIQPIRQGCGHVYMYFRGELVGLEHVCADFPILPSTSVVVSGSTNSKIRFIAGKENLATMRIDRSDLSDSEVGDIVNGATEQATFSKRFVDFQTSQLPALKTKRIRYAYPMDGEWNLEPATLGQLIVDPFVAGVAEIQVTPAKTSMVGKIVLRRDQLLGVEIVVDPIGKLVIDSPQRLVHKQGLIQEIQYTPISLGGRQYTESPLVDQAFHGMCEIDRNDVFVVSASSRGCVFEPIVVGANRAPLDLSLTITIGSFSQKFNLAVENHFHVIVSGPYMISVPRHAPLQAAGESVMLQLTNPTEALEECEVVSLPSLASLELKPLNETGHFEISRLSPKGASETSVVVQCGTQSLDFTVSFLEAPKVIQESYVPQYDARRAATRSSLVLAVVWWAVKLIASIAVIVGVAFLFQQRFVRPVLVKKELSSRHSAPPQFVPRPHPDKDVFITDRLLRRATHTRAD